MGRSPAPSCRKAILHTPFDSGPIDLFPRSTGTLKILLYSLHVHSDLLLRVGLTSASRTLIKVMSRFDGLHSLPLLNVDARFGHWGISRHPSSRPTPRAGNGFPALCESGEDGTVLEAKGCKAAICAVCIEQVRTLYIPCGWCGHGYHIACFRQRFASSDQKCPALGCECRCLQMRPIG